MNLYEQIEIVKKRPGNYIGETNLNNICKFIDGIIFSLECNNKLEEFDIIFIKYFNWYVNYKILNKNISNEINEELSYNGSRNFVKLISIVEQDKAKQTDIFFQLFEDFYIDFKRNYNFNNIIKILKK